MSNIVIDNQTYEIIDAKEQMTVPDCWVLKNKIGGGHGEAKFYIGQDSEDIFKFFDDFSRKSFFLKKDLMKYLEEVKGEYNNPEQPYKNKKDMPKNWKSYFEGIKSFKDELQEFEIEHQTQIAKPRIYINSKSKTDQIYKLIRTISLPNITYLSVIKLKSPTGDIVYYWKLFVDYFGEETPKSVIEKEEKEIKESGLSEDVKENLSRARKGQGKYRENLLKECPYCPITIVSDDRLLIASHIKPWAHSEMNEKTDPKNGFMFTPTYDFLFDRGFITFTDDKKMIVSPWLSKMTKSKLNLADNKKYPLLVTEEREKYLDYHRKKIFKS